MANKKNETTTETATRPEDSLSEVQAAKAAVSEASENAPKKKHLTDFATEIGTLTYPRAVEHFGKERAVTVIKTVAQIGGHGMFEESDIKSPLFGGLIMPDPEKVLPPQESDFPENLPDREFHWQAAQEEFEGFKKRATDDRVKINEYLNSLK